MISSREEILSIFIGPFYFVTKLYFFLFFFYSCIIANACINLLYIDSETCSRFSVRIFLSGFGFVRIFSGFLIISIFSNVIFFLSLNFFPISSGFSRIFRILSLILQFFFSVPCFELFILSEIISFVSFFLYFRFFCLFQLLIFWAFYQYLFISILSILSQSGSWDLKKEFLVKKFYSMDFDAKGIE